MLLVLVSITVAGCSKVAPAAIKAGTGQGTKVAPAAFNAAASQGPKAAANGSALSKFGPKAAGGALKHGLKELNRDDEK